MFQFVRIITLLVIFSLTVSCAVAPSSQKRATVNIAAFVYPGGSAPPGMLALLKAALEVNRTAEDFELRIVNVSPSPVEPGMSMEKPGDPPSVTALEQALGQDPAPDVVLFSGLYEFAPALEKDLLQPLDLYFRSDRNVKPDDYFPGAIEALSDSGRLYALPVSVAPTVLMYDKRVFEEAGLAGPEPNWNWSTFLGIAKQLTKTTGDPQNDRYAINLEGPMTLAAFIWQNGGDMVSKDGKRSLLNEPAAVEAAKFYADLIHTYKVVPPEPKMERGEPGMPVMVNKAMVASARVGPGDVPPLWGPGGRVAMVFNSGAGSQMGGFSPFMLGGPDRPMRFAELPRGKVPATLLDVYTAIGLTSKSKNGALAYKAMTALASEMQKELSVPARRSLAKNLRQSNPALSEDDLQVILNSLEYARPLPFYRGEVFGVLYEKLLAPIRQNTKPLPEVLKEASDALDEALNK